MFEEIRKLLNGYTEDSKARVAKDEVEEVKFVQPRSKVLLTECSRLIITNVCKADVFSGVKVVCKKDSDARIKYRTTLALDDGNIITVTGETDESLEYKDICIMPWEDKNLSGIKLTEAQPKAQILAEMKGKAEAFFKHINCEPQQYWAVLTTGILWSFKLRIYKEGHTTNFSTEVLDAREEDDFTRIVKLLILSITNCATLIKQIDDCAISALIVPRADSSADDKDSEEGGDNESFTTEDVQNDMGGLHVSSSSSGTSTTSGQKQGNSMKQRSFGTDCGNYYSKLTCQNVYAHTIMEACV